MKLETLMREGAVSRTGRSAVGFIARFCRKALRRSLLLMIGFFVLLYLVPNSDVQAKPAESVRLVLLLVIDQARAEYLERLRPIFKHGMKRLLDEGMQFTDAHQDHAQTSTGPGHASIATGLYPSHSGIVSNSWFDRRRKRQMYCVGDEASPLLPISTEPSDVSLAKSSSGRSPRNLLGTALPDWLKQATPRSKTFGVSRKDRSAILMGGKQADGAFWYDSESGDLITSRYYLDRYPQWMRNFLDRNIPDSYFGQTWTARPVDAETLKRLLIEEVDKGLFKQGFPYPFGDATLSPNSRFYGDFGSTPYFENYLLKFLHDLIAGEELGQDDDVDYVGVGFSVMDSVGHRYGPNSREVLDAWIRLDEGLGELFDYLDEKVGMGRVLISLSADHGVLTLPEYLVMKQQPGGRATASDVVCFQSAARQFEQTFGQDDWWISPFYLDYSTLGRRNLLRQRVEAEIATLLESCSIVEKVWTRSQVQSAPGSQDPFLRLFSRSFHPERSGDLFLQVKKYHLLSSRGTGTSHGSPYDYDTHVPLLLRVPGMSAKKIPEPRVRTVDLAPTLASLLGISAPAELDGVDRSSLLR